MIDPREQSSLFYVLEQLAWDLEVERAWVFSELERVNLEAGELEGARGYFDDRRLRARATAAADVASEPWREIVYLPADGCPVCLGPDPADEVKESGST